MSYNDTPNLSADATAYTIRQDINRLRAAIADLPKEDFVKQVEYLSQKEGLHDWEIAEVLETYRVKVSRCRMKYNIPRPVLTNRKDKPHRCKRCGRVQMIRRTEHAYGFCSECRQISREKKAQYKRNYMRMQKKLKGVEKQNAGREQRTAGGR